MNTRRPVRKLTETSHHVRSTTTTSTLDFMVDGPVDGWTDGTVDRATDWTTDWMADGMDGVTADWLAGGQAEWLAGGQVDGTGHRVRVFAVRRRGFYAIGKSAVSGTHRTGARAVTLR